MSWLRRRTERAGADAEATALADEARERARRTGDILRQSRSARGISIADVEQDIRISRVYIEALENARFDLLPAPVYARGFMRSYARYLGLDPDEALRAVPRDLPRPAGLDPPLGLRRAAPSSLPSLPPLNPPMAIAIGVAVLLLVAAIFFGPRLFGSTTSTAGSTPTATATAQVSSDAPNLVGVPRDAATAALERAGLTPLIFESANAATAGTVFRQSPGAGTPVKRGDVITLFVSQGAGGQGAGGQGAGGPGAGGAPTATATPLRTPTPTATPAR